MDNIENYKDALRSVQNKEIEQRKTIKKLLQDREELKKQLLYFNAKLIASAPEMLEALMDLENDNNSIPKPIWDKVQNAIKKALS